MIRAGSYLIRDNHSHLHSLFKVVSVVRDSPGSLEVRVIRVKPVKCLGVWEVRAFGRSHVLPAHTHGHAPHGYRPITEHQVLSRGY